VAAWRRGGVAAWRRGGVAAWRRGGVAAWRRGGVAENFGEVEEVCQQITINILRYLALNYDWYGTFFAAIPTKDHFMNTNYLYF
jgi:hypothetical protein